MCDQQPSTAEIPLARAVQNRIPDHNALVVEAVNGWRDGDSSILIAHVFVYMASDRCHRVAWNTCA